MSLTVRRSRRGLRISNRICRRGWAPRCAMPAPRSPSVRSHRKLILVLTDGEPSDIDVVDPRDLVEDARRAVLALRARGIDVFGVTLDPSGAGSGAAVFGRSQHMPVRRLEDLPARLAELYFRLARR